MTDPAPEELHDPSAPDIERKMPARCRICDSESMNRPGQPGTGLAVPGDLWPTRWAHGVAAYACDKGHEFTVTWGHALTDGRVIGLVADPGENPANAGTWHL